MKNCVKFKFLKFCVMVSALLQMPGAAPGVIAGDVSLPGGTQITLQLNDTLSTASNMEGDEFTAVVAQPVYVDDRIVIPKGSVVTGSVSRILHPDRLKGKAVLDLMFQSIRVAGYKQADIAVTLTRVDSEGSGAGWIADNFTEREKPTDGASVSGTPKVGVRMLSPGGKKANIGASGGLPSIFNSQGDDARIPRGSLMDITFDRPLTLVEETAKPAKN